LIVDWVSVGVLAFLLQGLWFGLGAFLESWKPDWRAGLSEASRGFLVLWLVTLLVGLALGYYRARKARIAPVGRR
jgi:hypothetical protein